MKAIQILKSLRDWLADAGRLPVAVLLLVFFWIANFSFYRQQAEFLTNNALNNLKGRATQIESGIETKIQDIDDVLLELISTKESQNYNHSTEFLRASSLWKYIHGYFLIQDDGRLVYSSLVNFDQELLKTLSHKDMHVNRLLVHSHSVRNRPYLFFSRHIPSSPDRTVILMVPTSYFLENSVKNQDLFIFPLILNRDGEVLFSARSLPSRITQPMLSPTDLKPAGILEPGNTNGQYKDILTWHKMERRNLIAAVWQDGASFQVEHQKLRALYIGAGLVFTFFLIGYELHRLRLHRRMMREKAMLQALFNAIPDPLWLKSEDGVYLGANPACERYFGLPMLAMPGHTDFDLLPREKALHLREKDQQALSSSSAQTIEEELRTTDGQIRHIETTRTPVILNGKPAGLLGLSRDITERREWIHRLDADRARYLALFSSLDEGVILIDPTGDVMEANPSAEIIVGDGTMGWRRRRPMLHEDGSFMPDEEDPVRKAFGNKQAIQNKTLGITLETGIVWIRMNVKPFSLFDGTPSLGVILSFSDVTELMEASRALDLQKLRYEELVQSVDGVVWEFSIFDDRFIFISRQVESLLGYHYTDWLKVGFRNSIIHPDDRERVFATGKKTWEENTSFDLEYRILSSQGRYLWIRCMGRPVQGGLPGAIRGLMVDVTHSRLVSERLRLQSETLELLSRGESLKSILEKVCLAVESMNRSMEEETLCSILLLDASNRLHVGAAPGLPEDFVQAIDGIEIGEGQGSCGTSAFRGERVVLEDVQQHPYAIHFRSIAEKAGLVSCWSQPIFAHDHKVLGTFALYRKLKGKPTSDDIDTIDWAARLIGLALERKRNEETVNRLNLILQSSPYCVVMADENGRIVYLNPITNHLLHLDRSPTRLDEIIPYEMRPWKDSQPALLTKKNGIWKGEMEFSAREKTVPADVVILTHLDEENNSFYYSLIARDVTAEKAASEKMRLAERIISQVREGLVITDPMARIIEVNDSMLELCGYSREEMIGKNPSVLQSGRHGSEFYAEMWRRLLAEGL